MSISFTCPHCGNHTQVSAEFAGMAGPCARCGQTITIPGAPAAADMPGLRPPPPVTTQRSALPWVMVALGGVMALFCCGGMGVALLLPAVNAAREAARRQTCQSNLRQIGLAIQNYHDDQGCLPPAYIADASGKPIHSWRVLLLPYLDEDLAALYDFNEPWDSEKNMKVAGRMPSVFRCPSDPDAQSRYTSYVASDGPSQVFQSARPVMFNEITDGLSNTIDVLESAGSGIVWTEPRDVSETLDSEDVAGQSFHPGGFNALYVDGHVTFVSGDVDPVTFEELVIINDGGVSTDSDNPDEMNDAGEASTTPGVGSDAVETNAAEESKAAEDSAVPEEGTVPEASKALEESSDTPDSDTPKSDNR